MVFYYKTSVVKKKIAVFAMYGLLGLCLVGIVTGCLKSDSGRPSTPVGTSGGVPIPIEPRTSIGTQNLSLSASPDTIPADGVNFTTLLAQLRDASGRSVENYVIEFRTDNIGGFSSPGQEDVGTTLQPTATGITNQEGKVSVRFLGVESGSAVVQAAVDLDQSGTLDLFATTVVILTPAGPPSSAGAYRLTLSANPNTIPNDTTTPSRIVAQLTNSAGGPVQNFVISFSSELGYLVNDITQTERTTATTAVTDSRGIASVFFFGQTAGSAVITARVPVPDLSNPLQATTVVNVTGDSTIPGEVSIELFVNPTRQEIFVGEPAFITARVTFGENQLLPGVPVRFSTSLGTVSPEEAITDGSGIARTTLTSPIDGLATVFATVDFAGGSTSESEEISVIQAPETITVSVPGTTAVTLGTETSVSADIEASASVIDNEGLGIQGIDVAFNVIKVSGCDAVSFSPTNFTVTTASGGVATFTFTATVTAPGITCDYRVTAKAFDVEGSNTGTIKEGP